MHAMFCEHYVLLSLEEHYNAEWFLFQQTMFHLVGLSFWLSAWWEQAAKFRFSKNPHEREMHKLAPLICFHALVKAALWSRQHPDARIIKYVK